MKWEKWMIIVLLGGILLTGCTAQEDTAITTFGTEPSVILPEATTASVETTKDIVEDNTFSHYIDVVYADQITRYYTALVEQWPEGKYYENNMSPIAAYYYDGDALENVGFGFADLDGDGAMELLVGAIQGAAENPVLFEIWTAPDGVPEKVVTSQFRDRFYLMALDDGSYRVANEGSASAFKSAYYYFSMIDGKLELQQGVIHDAEANEEKNWFMTYDTDWDTSNDLPAEESAARELIADNTKCYTAPNYIPYSFY